MAERPDWVLYRTVEGLQQKAGVPASRLRRLVLKELADGAFDVGTKVEVGLADDGDTYFVSDNGPGIDGTPDEIADLFSIRRPIRSSKPLRLPQRGAIGNGLCVVAGAVLASDGSLVVTTRNRRIVLSPQADRSTRVVEVISVDHPVGTHIEIKLGSALPDDPNALTWVREAELVPFQGKSYEGRSSPCWYDATQFHELILAHEQQPLRSLIAELDGCSGGKAGEIVAAAGLDRAGCENVTRVQATRLLEIVREQVRPVSPERLGHVGRDAFPDYRYAIERRDRAHPRNRAGHRVRARAVAAIASTLGALVLWQRALGPPRPLPPAASSRFYPQDTLTHALHVGSPHGDAGAILPA